MNKFNEGVSGYVKSQILTPLVSFFKERGLEVSVDEMSKYLDLPQSNSFGSGGPSGMPPMMPRLPGALKGSGVAPVGAKTTRGKPKEPVAPENQCMWMVKKKAGGEEQCPNAQYEHGYCKKCLEKKTVQKSLESSKSGGLGPRMKPPLLPGSKSVIREMDFSGELELAPTKKDGYALWEKYSILFQNFPSEPEELQWQIIGRGDMTGSLSGNLDVEEIEILKKKGFPIYAGIQASVPARSSLSVPQAPTLQSRQIPQSVPQQQPQLSQPQLSQLQPPQHQLPQLQPPQPQLPQLQLPQLQASTQAQSPAFQLPRMGPKIPNIPTTTKVIPAQSGIPPTIKKIEPQTAPQTTPQTTSQTTPQTAPQTGQVIQPKEQTQEEEEEAENEEEGEGENE